MSSFANPIMTLIKSDASEESSGLLSTRGFPDARPRRPLSGSEKCGVAPTLQVRPGKQPRKIGILEGTPVSMKSDLDAGCRGCGRSRARSTVHCPK
jgi:hypothetical protein